MPRPSPSKPMILLMVAALTLSGCGGFRDSGLNPFNWFGGGSRSAAGDTTENTEATNALIPQRSIFSSRPADTTYRGVAVAAVDTVSVDALPGGVIIRASGRADRLGAYDIRLTEESRENGVLTLALKALFDPVYNVAGTPAGRRLDAGLRYSRQDLRDIRTVRVISANNSVATRR